LPRSQSSTHPTATHSQLFGDFTFATRVTPRKRQRPASQSFNAAASPFFGGVTASQDYDADALLSPPPPPRLRRSPLPLEPSQDEFDRGGFGVVCGTIHVDVTKLEARLVSSGGPAPSRRSFSCRIIGRVPLGQSTADVVRVSDGNDSHSLFLVSSTRLREHLALMRLRQSATLTSRRLVPPLVVLQSSLPSPLWELLATRDATLTATLLANGYTLDDVDNNNDDNNNDNNANNRSNDSMTIQRAVQLQRVPLFDPPPLAGPLADFRELLQLIFDHRLRLAAAESNDLSDDDDDDDNDVPRTRQAMLELSRMLDADDNVVDDPTLEETSTLFSRLSRRQLASILENESLCPHQQTLCLSCK
jgi:hypothetical protein